MKPNFILKQKVFKLIYLKYDTQENLAREIKMDPSYLSKILLGKQAISIRVALEVSKALDLPIETCFEIKYIEKNHM